MTDNDIIKGAEHCLNPKYACDDCPYTDTGEHQEECMAVLIKDLLSLINRQKAEIERLNTLATLGNMRANDYRAMRDKAKNARADTAKECLEWVLSMFPEDKNFTTISRYSVNRKLKEMVGDTNV